MKPKSIQFNQSQFNQMGNIEFYLVILNEQEKKELRSNINEPLAGLFEEIISRRPNICSYYSFRDKKEEDIYLKKIVFEDGTPINKKIKGKTYIFKIDKSKIRCNSPPILIGHALRYNIHDNQVGNNIGKKLVLYFNEIPVKKHKSGIMCLESNLF